MAFATATAGSAPLGGLDAQAGPTRVLVVDDDPDIRCMLADYLEREGMAVSLAADGRHMVRLLEAQVFALVILDLRLGNEDGLDLLRHIRSRTDVAVIVVTGHRREPHERVLGLELGADDYIAKPFALREFLARIRCVLRRRASPRGVTADAEPTPVSAFEGWRLDRGTRRLSDPQGRDVPLTNGEYATLLAFLDRPGRILTRDAFMSATDGRDERVDRSVDVQILRLRRKLEADPAAPRFIKTERGRGYVFAVSVDTTA